MKFQIIKKLCFLNLLQNINVNISTKFHQDICITSLDIVFLKKKTKCGQTEEAFSDLWLYDFFLTVTHRIWIKFIVRSPFMLLIVHTHIQTQYFSIILYTLSNIVPIRANAETVSYTHLDVYKRQTLDHHKQQHVETESTASA